MQGKSTATTNRQKNQVIGKLKLGLVLVGVIYDLVLRLVTQSRAPPDRDQFKHDQESPAGLQLKFITFTPSWRQTGTADWFHLRHLLAQLTSGI